MKILYIPLETSTKETDGFYKALCRKNEVVWYWENKDNYEIDVIYLHSGAISKENLRQLSEWSHAKITQWTGDYRPQPLNAVTQYNSLVDITFLSADVPEYYPDMDIRWLPHGVDDWQFREVRKNTIGKIVMIANDYPQFPGGLERRELIKLMGDRLITYGSFTKQLDWYQAPDVYNRFKFAIGPNCFNDAKKYFSNRPLNAMAAGTCYLMHWFPGIEDLFEHGKECLIYRDINEVPELMGIDDNTRNEIARNGKKKVKEMFHYDKIAECYEQEINK